MAKDRSKVIETIRKLILHEQSAASIGSKEEAFAFAAKITALMREYRVERQEVEPGPEAAAKDYGESLIAGYRCQPGEAFPWQAMLFGVIATANACQTVLIRNDEMNRFFVVGQNVDRAITVALAQELCLQIDMLSAEAYGEIYGKDIYSVYSYICNDGSGASETQRKFFTAYLASETQRKFFTAYRSGFMQALEQRLQDEGQAAIEASEPMALMVRTALQRTQNYIEKRFTGGAVDETQTIEIQDEQAAQIGYADGMAASLDTKTLEQGAAPECKQVKA